MNSLQNTINFEAKIEELQKEVQKWRHLAERDGLTHCLRREAFFEIIEERRKFGLLPKELAIAVVDVDFFKRINDNYGHFAGDKVLEQLGTLLSNTVSAGGLVCRMGGEEFVIALPKSHTEALLDLVTMKRNIEEMEVKVNRDQVIKFTVSVGMATWDTDKTFLEAATRADAALYEAKNSGRNRIVTTNKKAA